MSDGHRRTPQLESAYGASPEDIAKVKETLRSRRRSSAGPHGRPNGQKLLGLLETTDERDGNSDRLAEVSQ